MQRETEFFLKKVGEKEINYKRQYVYAKLVSGSVCFGRVLNGIDIDGKPGIDHSYMTIISDSHDLILYEFRPSQLKFLPDQLKLHILSELMIIPEVDNIDVETLELEQQKWEEKKH